MKKIHRFRSNSSVQTKLKFLKKLIGKWLEVKQPMKFLKEEYGLVGCLEGIDYFKPVTIQLKDRVRGELDIEVEAITKVRVFERKPKKGIRQKIKCPKCGHCVKIYEEAEYV